MDKIIRKYSQINSLIYWFKQFESVNVSTTFDSVYDMFSIEVRYKGEIIYEKIIEALDKKSNDRVDYEFQQVINNLLLNKKMLEYEYEIKESS